MKNVYMVRYCDSGEWIDTRGEGGFEVFLTLADAEQALREEASASNSFLEELEVLIFKLDAVQVGIPGGI